MHVDEARAGRHLTRAAAWLAAAACGVLLNAGAFAVQRTTEPLPTFRDVGSESDLRFTNVNGASQDKHFVETMGSGGLFFDFDDDGWLDVFLVDGGSHADPAVAQRARHRLFRNTGGGAFEDVTAASGIRHRDFGMGACAGDYDNDGRVDLYVTNFGPDILYRNAGGGTFADVTKAAGITAPLWGTSCGFGDFDRDGDLDLFVTNYVDMGKDRNRFCGNMQQKLRAYCHPLNFEGSPNVLYRNDGKGVFTDVTSTAGVAGHRGNGLGVAIADYDDDSWPDVFVANDAVPNFLFHNEGKGRFAETALVAGVAVSTSGTARAGMGTAFGDYDGDGRLDLVVTNHETEMHSLFRNLGDGLFGEATVESRLGSATLPYVGFGVVFFDYDNDGALDLSIVNGHVVDNVAQFRSGAKHAQPRLLLRNTGGRFRDVSPQSGPAFGVERVGRGLAAGDVDNDGDLDLLVTNNGGAAELLRNDGGNRANALLLKLTGTRSNRDALGARVTVAAGSRVQVREVTSGSSYLAQNDLRVHVGLGDRDSAERVAIRWPSGATEVLSNVAANQIVSVREGAGIVSRVAFVR